MPSDFYSLNNEQVSQSGVGGTAIVGGVATFIGRAALANFLENIEMTPFGVSTGLLTSKLFKKRIGGDVVKWIDDIAAAKGITGATLQSYVPLAQKSNIGLLGWRNRVQRETAGRFWQVIKETGLEDALFKKKFQLKPTWSIFAGSMKEAWKAGAEGTELGFGKKLGAVFGNFGKKYANIVKNDLIDPFLLIFGKGDLSGVKNALAGVVKPDELEKAAVKLARTVGVAKLGSVVADVLTVTNVASTIGLVSSLAKGSFEYFRYLGKVYNDIRPVVTSNSDFRGEFVDSKAAAAVRQAAIQKMMAAKAENAGVPRLDNPYIMYRFMG
ncbi:MAG TPA: hypothetical protein P5539_11135 [Mesotoga sp.]|nr:hypothetical protein [Mesotoga sp.]